MIAIVFETWVYFKLQK